MKYHHYHTQGGTMKLIIMIPFMLLTSTLMRDCLEDQPVTGADNVQVISYVEFQITEKTATTYQLTVRGTIKNTGTKKISPPWYIEGDFYKDESYAFKLGGESEQINFALYSGETTAWELVFSSSSYDEGQFPHFGIKNLRAYYK